MRAEHVKGSISMVTSFDTHTNVSLSVGLRLGWPDPWPQDLACRSLMGQIFSDEPVLLCIQWLRAHL